MQNEYITMLSILWAVEILENFFEEKCNAAKTFDDLTGHGAAVIFLTEDYAICDRRFYNDSKYWDSIKSWKTMVDHEDIREFLDYFFSSKIVRYYIMNEFTRLLTKEEEFIKKDRVRLEKSKPEKKPDEQ